eukprot:7376458-Prymnesium_polylepis.1
MIQAASRRVAGAGGHGGLNAAGAPRPRHGDRAPSCPALPRCGAARGEARRAAHSQTCRGLRRCRRAARRCRA